MPKAISRDCKHSYINWDTGKVHCHKRKGAICKSDSCTAYRRDDKSNDSNNRRLDRM